MKKPPRNLLLAALAGFVAGALWVFTMRFIVYGVDEVHYHANFGVFINGEREQFTSVGFYEEVAACSQDAANNPRGRAHMHQPDNDVVHVHDAGSTWGSFFENIGFSLSNKSLETTTGRFVDNEGGDLVFILNGQKTRSIANVVIGDQDRLLVSYGDDTTDFDAQYEQISATAGEFNESYDPGGCAGSGAPTLSDRLKYAFDL